MRSIGGRRAGRALAWRMISAGIATVVAALLPPRCPGCGTPVAADHLFCGGCWGELRWLTPPWCATCNRPLPEERGAEVCKRCRIDPPRHAGIRAAVVYGAIARRLALKLKYGGRIGIAATMAARMAAIVPPGVDLLVPVPLHRWRLWQRGYNQAALIAAAIHRRTAIPHDPFALRRRRATVPLRSLGRSQRRAAVAGAFAVPDPTRIAGRSIALVDDVYTSGATAAACTQVLLAAGASAVTIVCWARVVGSGGD
ncbi:ComF family protein [Sphingomonas kyungheensis]|uniref:ComF family protein n=1 Tax=Sphingomonas kyungheensis TaxID=1069987 RepID=A0ABU8H6Y0_9SPHN